MFGRNKVHLSLLLFMQVFYCSNSFALDPIATATDFFADCSDAESFLDAIDATKEVFDAASDGASENSLNAAKKAFAILKEKNSILYAVLSDMNVLRMIYSLSSDAKKVACATVSHLSPQKKDVVHSLEVEEMYDVLIAKKLLEECLVKNARAKRGVSGRPEVCEEAARMFAMLAGDKHLDKLTKKYNKMRDTYCED